ncbi:MAG: AAA family ATPase [Bacillota bacterium]|nr:AAA family ATPase [Bacillota bacterium]
MTGAGRGPEATEAWGGWGFRLRSLVVRRFAALGDLRLGPFAPGLTLLAGPNEAGKSTLLAFWVDMLYDLPAPSRAGEAADPYRPGPGEEWGGEVELETGLGRIRLGRSFQQGRGRRRGRIWLERGGRTQEEAEAEAELSRLLGQVERSDYTTVFAFSLAELAALRQIDAGEVGKRIYSAGFGAAEVPAVEEELERRRSQIWTARSRTRDLDRLLVELTEVERELGAARSELEELEPLRRERERVEEEVRQLEPRLAEAEAEARRLRRLLDLRGRWQEWRLVAGEVEAGRRWAAFPAEAAERLEELQRELGRLESRRRELRAAMDARKSLLEEALPEAVLAAADEVEALLRELPEEQRRQAALEERAGRLEELRREEAALAARLRLDPDELSSLARRLGEGWAEAEAEGRKLAREALQARDRAEAARRRLEELELGERQAAVTAAEGGEEGAPRAGPPAAASLALGLAGLVALAVALLHGPAWTGWIGLLALAVALALALAPGRRHEAELRLRLERERLLLEQERRRLAEVRAAAGREAEEALAGLASWCRQRGLPAGLAPEELESWLLEARRLPGLVAGRRRLEQEQAALRQASQDFAARVAALAERLGAPPGVEALRRRLEDARERRKRREEAARELRALEAELAGLEEESAAREAALRGLLERAGVEEAAELPGAAEQAARWRQREAYLQRIEGELRAGALDVWPAAADPLAELDRQLAAADPARLEAEEQAAARAVEELRARRDRAHQRLGELRLQVEQLERSRRVAELEDREAGLRARLEACAAEWRRLTLALELLAVARDRFERERQPAVLQSASRLFARFTGGRYEAVRVALGDRRLRVYPGRAGAPPLQPWQLSRGTQEQLYLAMRLAYIEEVRRNGGSLPVVIDDALADFDPARLRAALRALGEFARGHQVLLFTCHPHVVEAAREEVPEAQVLELA